MSTPARTSDAMVGRTLGDFVLQERIGEGGFGAVYRALQPVLEREAVIKVLHRRLRASERVTERFLREARLASKLDHPYAAHIYAFGAEPDGELWIAMELVRGTPLDQLLEVQGPLPLDRFVPLLERICEVVHSAHEQGIVHRDLKPDNVMVLSRAGRLLPKLLDFGIAKAVADTPHQELWEGDTDLAARADAATLVPSQREHGSAGGLTRRGALMGSPPYMAPEQWIDAAMVDARSDLYALGVLSYELLTGTPPFMGATIAMIAQAHAHHPVPRLGARFPPALDAVLARVLAKRADERYASALEFAAAFRQASGIGVEAPSIPTIEASVRDAAIAHAPQPIAEAVATLDAARNAHQARDATWQLVRTVVRYLGLLALASRSRTRAPSDAPAVTEALRALCRRALSDTEWLELTRELVRPYAPRRDAYPLPELVDVFFPPTPETEPPARLLEELIAARESAAAAGGTEAPLIELLQAVSKEVSALLERLAWLAEYALIVAVTPAVAERWMGVRRNRLGTMPIRERVLPIGQPGLVDRDGAPVLNLAPLLQIAAPAPGAPAELFLFDGRGRHGARLIALPGAFERHDEEPWSWFRAQLSGTLDEVEGAALERPPYRGLATFTSEDAALFFGREQLVDTFMNRLHVQPLLAVVGRSGAGKSSFVQAGVIPALPPDWRALTLRPGISPLATLAARLAHAGIEAGALAAALRADAEALGSLLRADAAARGPLLLVVDQLEELFTLASDPDEARLFAEAVARAARAAEDPVRVVLTLRDDFLVRAEQVPSLRNRLGHGLQILTVPGPEDLLRILLEPARRASYEFEDAALPREMVEAVADQPGALALLSFTAAKLWELRDRHFKQITRKAYRSLGGVGGALVQHAEKTLAEMPPEERRLTREAFRHLVTGESTRAVLKKSELRQLLGGDEHAGAVLEKLVSARLLVASEDDSGHELIEIVHEALLTAWPRLAEWRREDAEGARLRHQLRTAAQQWEERSRPRGLLWRDDALAEYLRWRARHPGAALTDAEAAFAAASSDDAARGKRVRSGLVAATITVLTGGLLVLWTVNAREEEQRKRAEASERRSRRQVAELHEEHGRQLFLDGDPIRALVYLDAARRAGGDGPALRYLVARSAAILEKRRFLLEGHRSRVNGVLYAPDGARVYTFDDDGVIRAFEAASGRPLMTFSGHEGRIFAAEVAPDGARLVSGGEDGAARVWEAASGRLLHTLKGHGDWITQVRFGPEGRRVASASLDGTVRLWDAESGASLFTLAAHEGGANDACFTRDGARLYTAGADGTVGLWDTATGARVAILRGHGGPVGALTLDPGGGRVASAAHDGTVALWRAADGALEHLLNQGGSATVPARPAFSPDGRWLAANAAKEVHVFRVDTGERHLALGGHGSISSLAFSPDGTRVASSSLEGSALIWDGVTGETTSRIPNVDAITRIAFAPDGGRLAVSGGEGASIWDLRDDALERTLELGQPGKGVAFHPDGRRLIAGGDGGALRVFDLESGEAVASYGGHRDEVRAVDFGGDGATAVSAGADGIPRLWDAATGRLLRELTRTSTTIFWAELSPDGTRLATAHDDRKARIWDLRTGAVERELEHPGPVPALAWAPGGRRIGTCSNDGGRVFDLEGGGVTALPESDWCHGIAFSPDGARVVTGSRKVGHVWDAATGELEVTLEGHAQDLLSVACGVDGLVVTTSWDRTARVWDALTGRLLEALPHADVVWSAAVSPDGRRIATIAGRRVYLWKLPTSAPERERELAERQPFVLRNGLLFPRK